MTATAIPRPLVTILPIIWECPSLTSLPGFTLESYYDKGDLKITKELQRYIFQGICSLSNLPQPSLLHRTASSCAEAFQSYVWPCPMVGLMFRYFWKKNLLWLWVGMDIFIGPRCPWGPIYGSWCQSVSQWLHPRLCWDLTDVTLADEDSNSIPTDDVNRAFLGNVAMQVAPPGGQNWN